MLPASVFIGLISGLIFVMGRSIVTVVLVQVFCSWGGFISLKVGEGAWGDLWAIVGTALPYLLYVWIWIIGRFLGIRMSLMILIIFVLQLTGWLLLLSTGFDPTAV